jgi:hypothetical protein
VTTPINGLPYPNSSSPNNPPIHFQALNNQLDTRLVPQFSTTTARNSAITSPVNGMMCAVAGYPQIYRSGSWRLVTSVAYGTTSMATPTYTVSQVVATLNIADPGGVPYKIKASASVDLDILGAGVHARAVVRVNGTAINPAGVGAFNDTAGTITDQLTYLPTPALSGQLTGACTVDLLISKESGAAGNGFRVASTGAGVQFNTLWAEVIPV